MKKQDQNADNILNEPMAAYAMPIDNLFTGLMGSTAKQFNFMSDLDILLSTRQGFSKQALMGLAKKISLTLQEFANIMHISERTLQRYDDNEIIKTEYAEKAVELARLYTRGEEVFGSMDKFKTWMKSPVHAFRGDTPVSLLDTSIGFDLVFRELGRIEHGIFA